MIDKQSKQAWESLLMDAITKAGDEIQDDSVKKLNEFAGIAGSDCKCGFDPAGPEPDKSLVTGTITTSAPMQIGRATIGLTIDGQIMIAIGRTDIFIAQTTDGVAAVTIVDGGLFVRNRSTKTALLLDHKLTIQRAGKNICISLAIGRIEIAGLAGANTIKVRGARGRRAWVEVAVRDMNFLPEFSKPSEKLENLADMKRTPLVSLGQGDFRRNYFSEDF